MSLLMLLFDEKDFASFYSHQEELSHLHHKSPELSEKLENDLSCLIPPDEVLKYLSEVNRYLIMDNTQSTLLNKDENKYGGTFYKLETVLRDYIDNVKALTEASLKEKPVGPSAIQHYSKLIKRVYRQIETIKSALNYLPTEFDEASLKAPEDNLLKQWNEYRGKLVGMIVTLNALYSTDLRLDSLDKITKNGLEETQYKKTLARTIP